MSSRFARTLAAVAASLALALTAACHADVSEQATTVDPNEHVELTYWTWAPNMERLAEAWNATHPNIHVTVSKQDGGDATVTKYLTAIRAGSGAPDLIQAEYQKIPTLATNNAIADLARFGGTRLNSEFAEGTWRQVTLDTDAVYAIPQDAAPLMFFYRKDVFAELGLTPPRTWDDYAAAARAVHEADPNVYLGTFSANDAGLFVGLTQQAGASWWDTAEDRWSVRIDSEPSRLVARFWGDLVEEGVIDNKPMYTPEWNNALNTGIQVGWISAVWAPGVLAGNAGATAGKWAAAPLPQWDAQELRTGAWGGSATAVSTQTKHAAAAFAFATWLNTSPEATALLAKEAGVYPASLSAASSLNGQTQEFLGQRDFYELAARANDSISPFIYGPNVNVAFSAFNDEFAKAAQSRQSSKFLTSLTAVDAATRTDLANLGFDTEEETH